MKTIYVFIISSILQKFNDEYPRLLYFLYSENTMLTGLSLIILIIVILVMIIGACAILKWHPFLVLVIAAIVLGISVGMGIEATIDALLQGGGAVFASIGLIIALGTILGETLEKTGAITAIATALLKKTEKEKILPGISLMGAVTGIPVFCDSGFVILSSLARSLSKQSSVSYGAISIALATGLYTSHVLIPPTPGPLAAAGNFNMAGDIGWIMLLGIVVSIPAIIIGWLFARKLNRQNEIHPEAGIEEEVAPVILPRLAFSILPLLLPVILIAMGSMIPFFNLKASFNSVLIFICNPNIALLLGVFTAFLLPGFSQRKKWNSWIQHALTQAGPIILITAAGGALGAVLKATPLAAEFENMIAGKNFSLIIFYPIAFLLAAGLKTAQGSSTAALIITSSIMAPLLAGMSFNHVAEKALLVLSIGAGAMVVSHANDSYFWVINQYSKLPVSSMYRYFTTATFFMGIAVLASCMLLSLLF